jgi:hypothetical protein
LGIVVVHRRHVDFDRLGRLSRQLVLREAAQDRLATDNDDRILVDDLRRGPNGVLELNASHRSAPGG